MSSLLVPGDPGRQGTFIYVVTVENPRRGHSRQAHLLTYCGNLKNVYLYACMLYFRYSVRRLFT